MVGVTFSTGHHFDVNDILEVTLVHKDIVNEVTMFGPRMYPGCFKSVLLLEDGVGDAKLLLSAKLKHLLSLQLPTSCLPSTPFQESTSPRIITSSTGVLSRQLRSSE